MLRDSKKELGRTARHAKFSTITSYKSTCTLGSQAAVYSISKDDCHLEAAAANTCSSMVVQTDQLKQTLNCHYYKAGLGEIRVNSVESYGGNVPYSFTVLVQYLGCSSSEMK